MTIPFEAFYMTIFIPFEASSWRCISPSSPFYDDLYSLRRVFMTVHFPFQAFLWRFIFPSRRSMTVHFSFESFLWRFMFPSGRFNDDSFFFEAFLWLCTFPLRRFYDGGSEDCPGGKPPPHADDTSLSYVCTPAKARLLHQNYRGMGACFLYLKV